MRKVPKRCVLTDGVIREIKVHEKVVFLISAGFGVILVVAWAGVMGLSVWHG